MSEYLRSVEVEIVVDTNKATRTWRRTFLTLEDARVAVANFLDEEELL